MKMRTLLTVVVCLVALTLPVSAADWPGWRGPDRNDVSKETGLLKSWPKEGPKLLWTCADAGVGYSGPAIVGNRIYCQGAFNDKDCLYALDASTGKEVWRLEIASQFTNGWGDGARGTPTVDGKQVYAITGNGELICATTDGKKVWQVSFKKDFGGQLMSGWGYSESPLIDGDKVICTPGGDKGCLVALDKNTGKVIWRSTEVMNKAGYSSVIVGETAGIRQYIQLTRDGVVGVDAKDGKLLWQSKLGAAGTAAIPTPIFYNDHVFVTSGYPDSKAGTIALTPKAGGGIEAKELYSERTLVNKHGGVLLLDGVLYGNSEPGGPWVAMDFFTGKKLGWDGNKLGKGSITYADGRLYLYSEGNGTVVLLEPNPKEWKETGRFKLPKETTVPRKSGHIWTHPVVANGRLYLRDQDLIFCFDIKEKVASAK